MEGGLGLNDTYGTSRDRRGKAYLMSMAQKKARKEFLTSKQCLLDGILIEVSTPRSCAS
jgi:hypothetical protein